MSYFTILGVVLIVTMTILTAVLTFAMFMESLDYVDGKEVFVKKYAIISSVSFVLFLLFLTGVIRIALIYH